MPKQHKRLVRLLYWAHGDVHCGDYKSVEEIEAALVAFKKNAISEDFGDWVADLAIRTQVRVSMERRGRWWEYVDIPWFDKHQPMEPVDSRLYPAEVLHPGTMCVAPVVKLNRVGGFFVVFETGFNKSKTFFFIQKDHAYRYFEHLTWLHERKGVPGTAEYGFRSTLDIYKFLGWKIYGKAT